MKTVFVALVVLVLGVFAITAGANRQAPPPVPCEDCAKKDEPCTGSVKCCPGLYCISSSGGTPTCRER